jgi:predicted nucleotidyltransferase
LSAVPVIKGWVDVGCVGCSSLATPTFTHQGTLFALIKHSILHFIWDIKVQSNPVSCFVLKISTLFDW